MSCTVLTTGALLAAPAYAAASPAGLSRPSSPVAGPGLIAPALVSTGPGVVEAYTRGADGALARQVREGDQWSQPQSLGGQITSAPSAVSAVPGRVDVFARGGQGQLVQRYAVDGRWSPWLHLGGRLVGAPSVTSWAPGRLDVFGRGVDGTLRHHWFSAGRWSGWESLGGALTSAPSAVSMTAGRLDVFSRGAAGQLQHVYYPGGAWSPWGSLGGTLYSPPAAVTTGPGRLDILVGGGDGALREKSFVRGVGWSPGYDRLPGAVIGGPGAAALASGETVLAARDGAGQLLLRSRPGDGTWSPWDRGAPVPAPLLPVAPLPSAAPPAAPPAVPVAARPVADARTGVFAGLGAWVDLYDYALAGAPLTPDQTLGDLQRRGVRTLYLQTSRFSVGFDVASQAGRWVDEAHSRGIKVVGWYLPGYGDPARDLRRTLAVDRLVTPAGGRFDGVGVDIEAHTGIGASYEVSLATMNVRAAQHLDAVRAATSLPLAAITPQPTATDGARDTWAGFPWAAVKRSADVVLPMSYWPRTCHETCVRDYTATNARYAAAWTGLPVHIAGRGYPSGTTQVTDADIRAFVDGALSSGVLGASIYDYASTRSRTSWWGDLVRLNRVATG